MAIRPVRGLGWLGLQPIPRSCVCMCVHVCKHFFYAEYSAEVTIGDFLGKNRYSITLFFSGFCASPSVYIFCSRIIADLSAFLFTVGVYVSGTETGTDFNSVLVLCHLCQFCAGSVPILCWCLHDIIFVSLNNLNR